MNDLKKFNITPFLIAIVMLFAILFLYDLTSITNYHDASTAGASILDHSYWDSYTLQAMAWREGKFHVDVVEYDEETGEAPQGLLNILELAEYENKLYVSFPPFPSLVMLPSTFIFGGNTPNNLIIAAINIATAITTYFILKRLKTNDLFSAFIAVAYVFGSNILFMSLNGGVWFMAQAINLLLCTWAIHCVLTKKRVLSYALIALAVGCRPFSILLFPVLFVIYLLEDKKENKDLSIIKNALKQWKALIIPAIIGISYMAFNYARFKSPFEFGHNYLVEFTNSTHGQFSIVYTWNNLKALLFGTVILDSQLHFHYAWFDGFMFYIANPFFIVFFIRIIKNAVKGSFNIQRLVIISAFILNLLLLCSHKTLGGWQFGARYTVDLLPFALLYMLISSQNKGLSCDFEYAKWKFTTHDFVILIFAIMINAYGAVKFWTAHYN